MRPPQSILKDIFGYDSFLPLQREVIENVLAGRDTLAIMPTGGGKSLCYQIPALLLDGLTVVVSPLISLMQDQVEQLRAAGIAAVVLNSSISAEEYQRNMAMVRQGEVKLLYVAPETLLTERIFALLSQVKLDLLTIDEAHCISEWGHDFRPEYRQMMSVRQRYPQAVCLALTATATERVRTDIKRSLEFSQSNEFVASFNRKNLFIEVQPKTDGISQTVDFLAGFNDQSGIIYCFSRRQVDQLAEYLAAKGFSVRPYHAGLTDEERRVNQEDFIRDDTQIIVATIAFGMGINKPNVRFVLHYDLPKSIEGYYQEMGRAGRDGLPAHCLLLYSYADVAKQRFFINQKEGNERRVAEEHLDAIVRYAEDQINCRRKPLLAYFGETISVENCRTCDNCAHAPQELEDITIPVQKFLSCVIRTEERFGAGHITAVLRGSKNQKVLRFGHDRLSTYGIGGELSQKQWMHLSRQLLQMGYLEQAGEYRTLRLTEEARTVLRNRTTIKGKLLEDAVAARTESRPEALAYDHELFARLRAKRKALADDANVPPYVIFPDRTLVEMSAYFPRSRESLLTMNGVGQVKLERFGAAFLGVIHAYCEENGCQEKKKIVGRRSYGLKQDGGKRRHVEVGELFNAGESVEALAARYRVQHGSIISNLMRFVQEGNTLRDAAGFLDLVSAPAGQQKAAFQAFEELGTE
ncbi:MAG: DNA helicase RecQ, partial [Anaerolineaceae bacterium]|nr:DNA helicase RecQ [Anaerolineaceae bacterium]